MKMSPRESMGLDIEDLRWNYRIEKILPWELEIKDEQKNHVIEKFLPLDPMKVHGSWRLKMSKLSMRLRSFFHNTTKLLLA